MDGILQKIENVVDVWLKEFETNPIKAGVKLGIFYLIFRAFWREVKRS